MANMDNLIEPGRQATWIAATFVVALLALVVAIIAVKRNSELLYMTQTELLLVNQKIEALQGGNAPPASAEPTAPAATAE